MLDLRKLRQKNNLTQEELAKRLKLSRVAITAWENGKAEPRTLKTVMALAKELDVSIDDLMKAFKKTKAIKEKKKER